MAVSPSSSRPSSSPLPSLFRSPPNFTPIREDETEGDDEETEPTETTAGISYQHQPTPLHSSSSSAADKPPPASKSSRPNGCSSGEVGVSVSCSKCRPSSRDKISVVPLDPNGSKRATSTISATPNRILRTLFGPLAHKSPLHATSTPASSSSSAASAAAEGSGGGGRNEWKLTAAELSRKLLQATRKRDKALHEASRLKYSVAELERKLNGLESHCRDLQAALDRCVPGPARSSNLPVEPFLPAVSDARTAVRHLSRALLIHLRASPRSLERLPSLLHPYGFPRNKPGSLQLIGLESLLNRVFYTDFEQTDEGEDLVVEPAARCSANRANFEAVRALGWEEVLSKGTKHYSQGLSRFCDRRMSEVVGVMGWARAWPEPLLQAFFGAARGVWAVRLLARSVHPPLPILRVGPGARFDAAYMEDAAALVRTDRPAAGAAGATVRMMVAPGFYVHAEGCSVVKCRVLIASGDGRGSERDGPQECQN
ncbi:hypothetical protein AXF42_Ash012545 [Apostasia shenzhenica]|uniref:IRK-interacting protein n=1 Tax=Apostasia shenzhenica TaxID=1088818 RepID=A0A2I0ARB2_9ASPA|nr:hypothetical protein AXF42_Ash012545 [Apostasia shenzhenica]